MEIVSYLNKEWTKITPSKEDINSIPMSKGVYLITVGNSEVICPLYVGSSKILLNRIKNHLSVGIIRVLQVTNPKKTVSVLFHLTEPTESYLKLEREIISFCKPKLNIRSVNSIRDRFDKVKYNDLCKEIELWIVKNGRKKKWVAKGAGIHMGYFSRKLSTKGYYPDQVFSESEILKINNLLGTSFDIKSTYSEKYKELNLQENGKKKVH